FRAVAQRIEHEPRLDARRPRRRIDLDDAVHVLGEVDHHRNVAALAGEAGAGAARQDRRVEAAARRDRSDYIVRITRYHQANRDLTVIGGVRGVERAAAGVEADLAAHDAAQLGFERLRFREGVDRLAM